MESKEKEDKFLYDNEEDYNFYDNDYDIKDNSFSTNLYFKDQKTLISMGFNESLINKVYKNIRPVNLQEAIDYLNTDENNKFIHSFIPNEKNLCLICEESQYKHAGETPKIEDDISLPVTNIVHKDSLEKNKEKKEAKKSGGYSYLFKYECGICGEEIPYKERKKVNQPCKHLFCVDCWFEYLKEKINNANVYKINCMQHECGYSLSEYFVKSILGQNTQLLQKYDKFLSRRKLMESNKKIKFCPYPDCDGYDEKKNKKKKIVKCNFGHDFCFECGNKPHPKQNCTEIDEDFEKWKKDRIVKRCPHCKFWTEKNFGCNHMTCIQCQFHWCWLCEKECLFDHYDSGSCKDLQFKDGLSEEQIKELMENNLKNCEPESLIHKILVCFVYFMIYFFLSPYLYTFSKAMNYLENIKQEAFVAFYFLSFLPFFICAEIQTVTFFLIISIPAIFIPPYYSFLRYTFFFRLFGPTIEG